MNAKQIYCVGIAMLLAAPSLIAQTTEPKDTLLRELVIEKEYTPIVNEATKINELPAVDVPKIEPSPINYSSWIVPMKVTTEIESLSTEAYMSSYPFSTKRGYVDIALGTGWNIDGSAGYHILDNKTDSLSIFLQHNSVNSSVKYLESDLKSPLMVNNNNLSLGYKHRFNTLDLYIGGSYGYNNFNYYGQEIDPSNSESLLAMVDSNQVVQQLDFTLGAISNQDDAFISYNLFAGYHRYGNQYATLPSLQDGVAENQIWLSAELGLRFGQNSALKIGSRYDQLLYNTLSNYALLSLTPRYEWASDRLSLRAGLQFDLLARSEDSQFQVSPDVRFDWEFVDHFFLSTTIDGGKSLNTMSKMSQESIYINPLLHIAPTSTLSNVQMAVRSNYFSSLWMELYGSYGWVDGEQFAMSYAYRPYSAVDYMAVDANHWQLGAKVGYKYNQLLESTLHIRKNVWVERASQDQIKWNRPDMELNFDVRYNLSDKLDIGLDYYLGANRTALLVDQEAGQSMVVDMDNIHNLSLDAHYRLNKTFTFKVAANNMLFQQYDIWYGMPVQPTFVQLGVSAQF